MTCHIFVMSTICAPRTQDGWRCTARRSLSTDICIASRLIELDKHDDICPYVTQNLHKKRTEKQQQKVHACMLRYV